MTTRIAAIGVSHWHAIYDPAYLRQFAAMPGVSIVGVQDADQSIAAHRAGEIGGAPVFADYKAMIAETRPDFVLALGRHCDMAAVALFLAEERIPFLMEKPMGLNAIEVERIADKTEANGVFATVPMVQRFAPFHSKARALLDAGAFGPLSHVYVRMNRFSSERYRRWNSSWMLDPAQSGGGCLRNLATHGFDVFLDLLGEEFEIESAQLSNRALGEKVEDYASVTFRSTSGILGTLETGNAYPRRTAEGASALPSRDRFLDGADGEWKICGRNALLMSKDGAMRLVLGDSEESLDGMPPRNPSYTALEDALARWRAGKPPLVSVRDCWRSVKLIDDAYRLARPLA